MVKRDPWKVTLAAVAGLILLACGGGAVNGGGSDTTVPGGAPPDKGAADVKISKCAFADNPMMGPEATVRIVNGSSKASNYMVQIAFVTPDGATQLDTASVMVNGLAPGQASEQVASSFKSELRKQAMTCKVLDVTRFAA